MTIKILPSRKIEVGFGGKTPEHGNTLVLDKWTLVVATFSYYKNQNFGSAICDLMVGTTLKENAVWELLNLLNLPRFAVSDKMRIGGSPSFVGELSTINIYGPGALLPPGMDKKKFSIFLNRILPSYWLSSRTWI